MSWWSSGWSHDGWWWDGHGRHQSRDWGDRDGWGDGQGDGWWQSGPHESHQTHQTWPESTPESETPDRDHDELAGELNYSYLGNTTKNSSCLPAQKQVELMHRLLASSAPESRRPSKLTMHQWSWATLSACWWLLCRNSDPKPLLFEHCSFRMSHYMFLLASAKASYVVKSQSFLQLSPSRRELEHHIPCGSGEESSTHADAAHRSDERGPHQRLFGSAPVGARRVLSE